MYIPKHTRRSVFVFIKSRGEGGEKSPHGNPGGMYIRVHGERVQVVWFLWRFRDRFKRGFGHHSNGRDFIKVLKLSLSFRLLWVCLG